MSLTYFFLNKLWKDRRKEGEKRKDKKKEGREGEREERRKEGVILSPHCSLHSLKQINKYLFCSTKFPPLCPHLFV